MNKFLLILLLLNLTHCGSDAAQQNVAMPEKPVTCTVVATSAGAVITCPDGSTSTISNGNTGLPGVNGLTSLIMSQPADVSLCPNGGTSYLIGLDSNKDGILELNEVSSTSTLCNGSVGPQGVPGVQGANAAPTPFATVNIIEACTNASSPFKEVLLCLENGSVLADFSDNANGSNTRLAFIPTGSYVDTDASGCDFSVTVAGDGSTTVMWNAGPSWDAGVTTCEAN